MKVLESRPDVALTIDSNVWPHHVLLIRGTATVERMTGLVPEYLAAAERYFGPEQGAAWVEQAASMGLDWARIVITPTKATILDFETRFPSAISS